MRRNVALSGGWLLVILFGVNWLYALQMSLGRRAPTTWLLYCTIMLIAVLLVPKGASVGSLRQWLAVPGGLVLRKGSWFRRQWTLHLFDRPRSLCVLYKLANRRWVLVVADEEACESAVGTKEELNSALRAWLSPLASPTAAQLDDLR